MKFDVKTFGTPNGPEYKIGFIEGDKLLFSLRCLSNTVEGWCAEFDRLSKEDPLQWQALFDLIPMIPDCHPEKDQADVYWNSIQGLFELVARQADQSRESTGPLSKSYLERYQILRQCIFRFETQSQPNYWLVKISCAGKEIESKPGAPILFPRREYDGDALGCWQSCLADVCEKGYATVVQLVRDYEHFRANVVRSCNKDDLRVFTDFSKAIVSLLESNIPILQPYASSVLGICAFIVEYEVQSPQEQKVYLEKILAYRGREEAKRRWLKDIISDIRSKDYMVDSARLATIVSMISDYYMGLYDLTQSANSWKELETKDWLLRLLLSMHCSPQHYAVGSLVFFLLMAVLSFLNKPSFRFLAPWQPLISQVALIALALLYSFTIAVILWIGYRLFWEKDVHYLQLFMPRLVGAIVVGLAVLLVQDTPWRLGILSAPLNLGFVCLLVYSLSFGYIFREVYTTIRYLPIYQEHGRGVIKHALVETRKIFSIALVEALVAVILSSTIFFPAMGLEGIEGPWGIVSFSAGGIFSFGFSPGLVVLWTGLTLFLGSYVQLFWQNGRITTSA